MKISEGGTGGVPFERMDHAQLIQGFSDQTKVADAHFLVLLSLQTRKRSPEEMGLLV